MNAQQTAAYEKLCAKVPEAKCQDLYFEDSHWVYRGEFMEAPHALAILTDHLERMLPPGSTLYFPWHDDPDWTYLVPKRPAQLFPDPDRFIALCRAVEASR